MLRLPVVPWYWGVVLAAVVIKLDHSIKTLMLDVVGWGQTSPVMPGIVQWHVVKNTGAAWSLFGQHPELLRLLTGVLLAGLVGMAVKYRHPALWLVVGAALSNWWDRWQYQGVVDYVELQFMYYPVFNLADVLIVLCGLWIAVTYWHHQTVE